MPHPPWVHQTYIYLGVCCFIPSLHPQLFILHVDFNEGCNKGMIRINSRLWVSCFFDVFRASLRSDTGTEQGQGRFYHMLRNRA